MKGLTLPMLPIRFACERDGRSILLRMWWRWVECAYIVLGIRGLCATIEFPSDWHEHRVGWVKLGLGLITISIAFPWKWTVPDECQCSGPTYGFYFFEDLLRVMWGKDTGRRDGPYKAFWMPWSWRHREHEVIGPAEAHPFRYVLRSGQVQYRIATIKPERRLWTRPWLPYKRESRYINIDFNDEVDERTGSWKGGVLGCSYDMLPGEQPIDTLRRMERERKF